ncbi:MAG: rod shape-determining protein MreC [Atopobiaceae bacterium]|nr:rod shape-determining protein MreC [Atopobiaceae bacterium]
MPLTGKGTTKRPNIRRGDASTGGRLLIVLVVVSLLLLFLGTREGPSKVLSGTRDAFQTITKPVRYLGSLITSPFDAAGNIVANLTTDQETLSELRAENQQLRARNAELEEAALTTGRLESLIDLKNTYSLTSTGARIISNSSDSWTATVVLDKGTTSGVAVGMPVTDSVGVIGQVIACGPTTATVRLISDESSGVSAMVQSSRAQGVLKGSATGSLRLTLIRTDQTVAVGDTVVTSGLGGVFPKGLPLGKVVSVEKPTGAPYYDIVVEALSSAESLEEVLVITSVSAEQQATAEDIAEADAQETSGLENDDAMKPQELSDESVTDGDEE